MKVEEESEKVSLKLNIQKTKIMASGLGKQWTQWRTLFLGDSTVTADGDCSHELKNDCSLEEKLWPT